MPVGSPPGSRLTFALDLTTTTRAECHAGPDKRAVHTVYADTGNSRRRPLRTLGDSVLYELVRDE
jgi:hypothetical protein